MRKRERQTDSERERMGERERETVRKRVSEKNEYKSSKNDRDFEPMQSCKESRFG